MLAMQGQHQLLRERREGRDKGDCRKERSGRGGLGGKKKRMVRRKEERGGGNEMGVG